MSNFLEQYGKAIFVLVLIAILIAFASPIGLKIKNVVLTHVNKLDSIGNEEIENRNSKNYESVDIEKSWTETHKDSYFFERVSSDKTNTDYNKWKSNNEEKNSTSAVSTFTIDVPKDMEYSFNWTVSSESYDKLTITCNGTTVVNKVSGTKNGTQKVTLKSGTNTLTATYSKDGSISNGDDCATITLPNVKVSICKNKQTGEILDHNYDKGKITKEATCTKNGEKTFTCKNCGKTKTEIVKMLGHTCTTVGEKCNRCDYILTIDDLPTVDQVYCIYYDDGEMTISQNEIESETGRTVVKEGFYTNPPSCTNQMTTIKFEGVVKLKSCRGWFYNCTKLTEIKNIKNLYTNECTNMSYMFDSCSSLTNLDLSGFDTSKVTDMSFMFENCQKLTNLAVNGWKTGNVTNMSYMFDKCQNLTSLDIQGFDTSKVTNMVYMFENCQKLTNLAVNGWKTGNVTNMSYMFCGCHNLNNLNISGWNTSKVTDMSLMFNNCENLTSLDLSGWNTVNVTKMWNMFSGCYRLTSLDVKRWNTGSVTNMSNMFFDCLNLTSLDLSGWNTVNVTKMNCMFYNCKNLTNLDVHSWKTGKVTSMERMFGYCENLTNLDLNGFNTENVTDMSAMFDNCNSLIYLDVSGFDTRKVTGMSSMFQNCYKLISLDLSEFNTENVTDMRTMFYDCFSLTSIDLSGWNIKNNVSMNWLFSGCNSLQSITAPQTVKDKILNSNNSIPSDVTWTITN